MPYSLLDFSTAKILIVGDLILDAYWSGKTSRISPEAPIPIIACNEQQVRLGGAANVALNIKSLGGEVKLIGVIGDDDNGKQLLTLCRQAEIETDFIISRQPTIKKLRVLSRNQQLIRIDFEEPFIDYDQPSLIQKLLTQLANYDVLIISDYLKGTIQDLSSVINKAQDLKIPVIVDPKGNDFSKYHNATSLTPNLSEFEAIVGKCANEDEIYSKGQQLIANLNLDYLLITRSEKGMTLLRKDVKQAFNLPTHAQDIYDVTGAGDTVIATFALAIAAKSQLENAVYIANVAAGIVVAKLGTSTVSLTELKQSISHQKSSYGVVDLPTLLQQIAVAKNTGEKIVFTNGCFDILHAGHVSYLANAAELGDRLIVAVNSDQSVQRLKGYNRPINQLSDRMAVLAGLRSVDWVVEFTQDTPLELISLIKPDFLVKGGDYKIEDIVGYQQVIDNGGQVLSLNLVADKSTTQIVNKIQKNY